MVKVYGWLIFRKGSLWNAPFLFLGIVSGKTTILSTRLQIFSHYFQISRYIYKLNFYLCKCIVAVAWVVETKGRHKKAALQDIVG